MNQKLTNENDSPKNFMPDAISKSFKRELTQRRKSDSTE